MTPKMSGAEIACLRETLAGRSRLLEFGCGGSTVLALQAGMTRVFSVETDRAWIAKVQQDATVRASLNHAGIRFLHVDLGPTQDWGYPADTSKIFGWSGYWKGPWSFLSADDVDCVLVDGRFRVACTLYALTRVAADTVIIIHDFTNRPEYHPVLKHLTCVRTAGTLAVFTINPSIDAFGLLDDILAHSLDPR